MSAELWPMRVTTHVPVKCPECGWNRWRLYRLADGTLAASCQTAKCNERVTFAVGALCEAK